MKPTFCFLTLLLASTAFGQVRDRRAELDIQGRVNEISVSPDEKIWLTSATGKTYYTNNIDSNWHYGQPLFENDPNGYNWNEPHLDRITYFNTDTAIMTGYIAFNQKTYRKNGYYLTKDAGKTWEARDYGGDAWIYCAVADKNGNAWMGGSSGEIFFSDDFGRDWKKLNSPYNSSTRVHSIFMSTSTYGISGALANAIYLTNNNWKSCTKIETPFDQQKYVYDAPGYTDHRIENIIIWGKYFVVEQDGRIFYTESGKIDWKTFPVKIHDFELDPDSQTLLAVTDSLTIVSFTSPTEFESYINQKLSFLPIDLQIVNHSLFVLSGGYNVCKVNKSGVIRSIPVTTDKPIAEPQIVKHGMRLKWGANGHHVYLADDSTGWYRENVLDFSIVDMMLVSDSVAIFWNGYGNYLYSLKDHTAKKYIPELPLKSFLASPIKTFSISSGSHGCFHSTSNGVNYIRAKDSTFEAASYVDNNFQGQGSTTFKNNVSADALYNALVAINSKPSAIPSLKDFQITKDDKKKYLSLVDKRLEDKDPDYLNGKKKIDKTFYYSVPAMLDTLNDSIVAAILKQREGVWSTTSNWFYIRVINENHDTLNISRNYYVSSLPWNLPWEFEYNGLHFDCYSIEFSRFINTCLPENFIDKDVFDNSLLIMEIADYLWSQEE